MPLSSEMHLLLVSNDYATLKAIRTAAAQLGADLACMATSEAGCDYVGRRKIDGIILDLELPAWELVLEALRLGTSNHFAVAFACTGNRLVGKEARARGAHVVLQKPLRVDDFVSNVQSARDLMIQERRRYFRHQVYLPLTLTVNGAAQHALITNLSEGGMAVRVTQALECCSLVDFSFQLRAGPSISGRGNIAWRDSEGMVGIGFQFLRDGGKDALLEWIRHQERLTMEHPSWGPDPLSPQPTRTF
jgi:CheY-like chemotaxis protein